MSWVVLTVSSYFLDYAIAGVDPNWMEEARANLWIALARGLVRPTLASRTWGHPRSVIHCPAIFFELLCLNCGCGSGGGDEGAEEVGVFLAGSDLDSAGYIYAPGLQGVDGLGDVCGVESSGCD